MPPRCQTDKMLNSLINKLIDCSTPICVLVSASCLLVFKSNCIAGLQPSPTIDEQRKEELLIGNKYSISFCQAEDQCTMGKLKNGVKSRQL